MQYKKGRIKKEEKRKSKYLSKDILELRCYLCSNIMYILCHHLFKKIQHKARLFKSIALKAIEVQTVRVNQI